MKSNNKNQDYYIDGSTEICLYSPTENATVYTGYLTDLSPAIVESHIQNADTEYEAAWLTLDEIAEQIVAGWRAKDPTPGAYEIITVITSSALEGDIYMYGNHGPFWEKIGTHRGYA